MVSVEKWAMWDSAVEVDVTEALRCLLRTR